MTYYMPISLLLNPAVTDANRIRLGGGYRLPRPIADAGRVRLGGGYRLAR